MDFDWLSQWILANKKRLSSLNETDAMSRIWSEEIIKMAIKCTIALIIWSIEIRCERSFVFSGAVYNAMMVAYVVCICGRLKLESEANIYTKAVSRLNWRNKNRNTKKNEQFKAILNYRMLIIIFFSGCNDQWKFSEWQRF